MKKFLNFKNIVTLAIFIVALVIILITGENRISNLVKKDKPTVNPDKIVESDFNLKFLKTVNSVNKNKNYLISPYSVEIALSMLNEGADGNTKEEITSLIGSRNISDVTTAKVKVANAIFIKNDYKDIINKDFTNTLSSKYNSEVIYDEFVKPNVINDWVNTNTNGMIKRLLDEMSKDFVLGIANAIAIDVLWENQFECNYTRSATWTNGDKTLDVEMMHNTYNSNVKYFITDNETGVVIPYQASDGKSLEFVGVLPTESLDKYISNISKDVLDSIDKNTKELNSKKQELQLALPRFSYSYTLEGFSEVLKAMGMNDAFSKDNANFSKITTEEKLYVATAIHKTYIDLNEKGTKAAAVTYFGMDKATALPDEKEIINITFDKPFLYMIRDSKTKEMLFVGTVYEPNVWKGSTCDNL